MLQIAPMSFKSTGFRGRDIDKKENIAEHKENKKSYKGVAVASSLIALGAIGAAVVSYRKSSKLGKELSDMGKSVEQSKATAEKSQKAVADVIEEYNNLVDFHNETIDKINKKIDIDDIETMNVASSIANLRDPESLNKDFANVIKDDYKPFVHYAGINQILKFGDKSNLHLVEPYLGNNDSRVYTIALHTFMTHADKEHLPKVTSLLKSEDSHIRDEAIKKLGEIGDDESIEHLKPFLDGRDGKDFALESIAKIGTEKAKAIITPLLSSDDHLVIANTLDILAFAKNPVFREFTKPLIEHPHREVMNEAYRTTSVLSQSRDEMLELLPLLGNSKIYLDNKAPVLELLSKFGEADDVKYLTPIFKYPEEDYSLSEVPEIVVKAVGNIGTVEHIPMLEKFAEKTDKNVKEAVIEAIEKIKTRSEAP